MRLKKLIDTLYVRISCQGESNFCEFRIQYKQIKLQYRFSIVNKNKQICLSEYLIYPKVNKLRR